MKRKLITITIILALMLVGNSFASAQQNDATIELQSSVIQAQIGDEFDVHITVKNPEQQNIISVRSWLSYDTNALEGVDIDIDDSPYTLSAPGEDTFASAESRMKLGRSNISGGVKDIESKVATVRFRVKTPVAMTTVIAPYDYQVTELGHVSVNIIDQGFPVNILSEEPEEIRIELNPGSTASAEIPEIVVISDNIGSGGYANLNRPQNLMVNTGLGYADLKWDFSDELELVGYNVYYGKTSGQYTRRRTVGKTDRYRVEGLNNGETYYFAITAYDQINRESDYSDEVGVIINEPLSSTSPFEEILQLLLAKLPEQPQNGPLMGWLIFSAVGLGGSFVFRKKGNNETTKQRYNETIKI